MRRYLLDSEGVVVNTILLDDGIDFTPPRELILAPKEFTPPVVNIEEKLDPMKKYKLEYKASGTDSEKIDILAKALGLKEDD